MSKFLTLVNGVRRLQLVDELDLVNLETDAPIVAPMGRLTLSSSDPVADGSNGTLLYYLPYAGNLIPRRSTSTGRWRLFQMGSGISISISTRTPGNHDIFFDTNGLGLQAWTNDTTRSVGLEYQEGLLCGNFGSADKRTYLGTIRLTGTSGNTRGQDTASQRYVWNAWNRVNKLLSRIEAAASWTYNSSTARPWNNSTANRLEVVCGQSFNSDISFIGRFEGGAGVGGALGIGLDTTTAHTDFVYASGTQTDLHARFCANIAAGYHFFQATESTVGTATFRGAGFYGLKGVWLC